VDSTQEARSLSKTSQGNTTRAKIGYEREHDLLEQYRITTEAMLNSLGEGLIATNKNGEITMVNSYAIDALGYSEAELKGQWLPKKIIATDQFGRSLVQLNRPIIRALTTGKTVSSYAHYLTKSGKVIPVFINVSPVVIDNVPTGAIEVFRDLTSEQQLDIAKDEFVTLASHQLRTPATAVKSILSMLASGDFGPITSIQRRYLDKAILSNDRQLQVIEDLLNVALVDSGKMDLDLEYIDVAGIVREAVADLLSTISSRNQLVELNIPSSASVLADAHKIRMVLDNLISNASKYSPEGSTIHIGLTQDSNLLCLSVRDEGVGIPEEELPKLFTKFTRLPNELSATVGGTGLGLFLAKNVTELHKGTLSVSSQEGTGSTFTVSLPTKWGAMV
jgi:PAS domain S-box-containing protein